ncbi:MAG: hydroxyectoine utilization dehydratase EutB [Alphaproteobacteria bacterium]|nr:hydroxyectoine utilization dehydratase EutB [Alphaproteobacteria bacterium]
MNDKVTLDDIYLARTALAGRLRRTPLVLSASLSALCGAPVYLKLEHQQITGSFKLRGATNAVSRLTEEQRRRGIVGVSTGNHGRGLAYAAKQANLHCIICMSSLVPRNKIDGIEALGAEVRIVGDSQDDAQREVDRLISEQGMTMVPPFDHRDVIAGQGTLGLEIVEDLAEVATIIVPLSGGGLISGIALATKAANPDVRVIGVTMEKGAAMYESQRAGKPVEVEELPTLADSLGGGVGADNRYTFKMVRDLVDDIVLISEHDIAAGIRHAYWSEQQVIEGGGAVGLGALLAGRVEIHGPTAVVVSGCNIDMAGHAEIIAAGPRTPVADTPSS